MTSTLPNDFDTLLRSALADRHTEATAPAALEQRLLACIAQEADRTRPAQPLFAYADRVRTPRSAASTWFAVAAHAAILLWIVALAAQHIRQLAPLKITARVELVAPTIPLPIAPRLKQIGGGGGQHDLSPATARHLSKLAQQQLLAPKAPPTIAPKLAVEPSIVVQKDLKLADNTMPNIGAPTSNLRGFSLGNGHGTGIGSGSGNGIGAGDGGNTGGGVLHIGGAVRAPSILVQVDPEYSEEARKAKFSGNVQVYLIVDAKGNPTHIRVVRGAGMGLDEKAVEAVRQYKFKPALEDGKPVAVDLYMDVNFQIF